MEYPRRPPWFCSRALQRLIDPDAFPGLSRDGLLILAVLLVAEDEGRYSAPPAFTDERLAAATRLSVSTIRGVRPELVRAGLLSYKRGVKGKPGEYVVTDPTGPIRSRGQRESAVSGEKIRSRGRIESGKIRSRGRIESEPPIKEYLANTTQERGGQSPAAVSQTPVETTLPAEPNPVEVPVLTTSPVGPPVAPLPACRAIDTTGRTVRPSGAIVDPGASEGPGNWFYVPQKVGVVGDRFPMFDAVVELTGETSKASAGRVGKLARQLVSARVTREELFVALPAVLQAHGKGWYVRAGLIDLSAVEKYWQWVREPPKPAVASAPSPVPTAANGVPTHDQHGIPLTNGQRRAMADYLEAKRIDAASGGRRPY